MTDLPDAQEADPLQGVRNSVFLESQKYRDQQTRAVRDGVHPDILAFEKAFVREMRRLIIPVFAHNMMRDDAHQNGLFATGVSRAKAGQSPHNYGLAVDLVHGTKAWDMTREQWDIFGHVGKEVAKRLTLRLVWGGDWASFWDPAHWELDKWKSKKTWHAEQLAKELSQRQKSLRP